MNDIACSIVFYNGSKSTLEKAVMSFLNTDLKIKFFLIDNSEGGILKGEFTDKRVEYIPNYRNIGFGAAHNIGMRRALNDSRYYLVLNPDVYFQPGTMENILGFMDRNNDVGLLMPKVLYPDGTPQYLCKLLPTPFNFFVRRFIPKILFLETLVRRNNDKFELRFTGYDRIMDVPVLSGCFMFIRTETLKESGIFDERYFLYCEDFDLCRRIRKYSRTVFYPEVSIFHGYERASARDLSLLKRHVESTVRYFNKWGWFFDSERWVVNNAMLKKYGRK